MPYQPGAPYVKYFSTADPSTGSATNGDSTPTATAYFDGSGTGAMALTVTNVATGLYKITGTVPSTRVRGDALNVCVNATVSGVAGVDVIDTQRIDDGATVLDAVTVETNINGRQALSLILAAQAGGISVATGPVVVKGAGTTTTRLQATTNNLGERSAISLFPPP